MNIQIITKPLNLDIYGYSSVAINKNYVELAFQLSGKMWETVKARQIKNKGKNIWVYDKNHEVFAGVELEDPITDIANLEKKIIPLPKYAFYKHIGPYGLIKTAGQNMTLSLQNSSYKIIEPYIEIYGHWTSDESKLETDLLMALA